MFLIKTKKQYNIQKKSLNKLTTETNYINGKSKCKRMKKKPKKRRREETCCRSEILSRGTIPQYFYMPRTQAAKEPTLGLAPLKKRCWEPKVEEPRYNHACDIADGVEGGKPYS